MWRAGESTTGLIALAKKNEAHLGGAEVDVSRQLPDHHDVHALHDLALQRGSIHQLFHNLKQDNRHDTRIHPSGGTKRFESIAVTRVGRYIQQKIDRYADTRFAVTVFPRPI